MPNRAAALLIVLSCVVVGCTTPDKDMPQVMVERLDQTPEGRILLKGIDAQGGLEAWASTKVLAMRTRTKVFTEDGSIQTYVCRERFDIANGNVLIIGADENMPYRLGIYEGSPYMIDAGKPVDDVTRVRQAHGVCLNARYVASLPFLFAGKATELESLGQQTVDDKQYQELAILHPAWIDEEQKDRIVVLLDDQTGLLERYLFADSENQGQSILAILSDFRDVGPLRLPFSRDYWRADSEGNPVAILSMVTVEVGQHNPLMEPALFAPGDINP